jgi:DNA sulfur modification protein DndC
LEAAVAKGYYEDHDDAVDFAQRKKKWRDDFAQNLTLDGENEFDDPA